MEPRRARALRQQDRLLTAPVGSTEERRRPLRPGHVLVTLEDLLILTWTVPERALRARLNCGLEPWSSGGCARVSALLFRNRRLRPAWIRVPRLSSCQLNLRSYVLDPETGRRGCVFFHGLYLDRPLLARISALVLSVPFRCLPFSIGVEQGEPLRWRADAPDGRVRIRARAAEADPALDAEALDLLTNPHSGVVEAGGICRRWSIWHCNQTLRTMAVEEVRIEPLERLFPERDGPTGLLVDSIDYEVYLPARKMGLTSAPRTPRRS